MGTRILRQCTASRAGRRRPPPRLLLVAGDQGRSRALTTPRACPSPTRTPSPAAPSQEIKGKTAALQQSVMKIGEALAGKQGGGGEGGSGSEGGSTTQDAEVKDKP